MTMKHNWIPVAIVMAFFSGLPASSVFAQSSVQMREEPLVIPTYRAGEPDKNPIFYTGRSYQGAKGPVYPYPILDKLTDIKEDRTYHAVRLENPYVSYVVLPEIGGRIFSGRDMTNGYDFVYRQHVIKPALIGMVGAWISGGIEWNIPHHHRASTFMTVDHTLVDNPDGSKTVWVGETELRHRMKWLVGMTLYPDKSYLKVTVKLFNRTPLPHSLLYFANIAVHANPDYQVIFPPATEYGTQHAKTEFVNWPIGKGFYGGLDRRGVDVSWWKNLPKPVSIFAWNHEDDFFGGYDHGRKGGIAVVADHHIAPGKKFFEWGNGNEGLLWDKILTDTDGPYLELMAGGYSDNQPDYSWIQPGETKVVEQFFYPIRELGGIKNANIDAAVNLEINDKNVARVALNTTALFPDARVTLTAGDKVLFEQRLAISPETPFVKELALPEGTKAEDLRVSLTTADNRELISYRPTKPKNSPMPRPVQPPPAPKDVPTNDELCLAGLRLEQFYSPAREPDPYYEEAIKRDPGDYRANVALGILYCERGLYNQAQERLTVAVDRATRNYTRPKDGEAFYYLGIALRAQSMHDAARDAFNKATWSLAWSAASNLALAEDACRRGDLARALEFNDRSIATNAMSIRALDLKVTLLRKLGQTAPAEALAAGVRALDPLDHWSGNEQYLLRAATGRQDEARKSLDALNKMMRGEPSSYLELAANYGSSGLLDEAIDVLNRFVDASPDKSKLHPMVRYFLAYYLEQRHDDQKAAAQYRLASQLPPDRCFPFQLEAIDVLGHAIAKNPADARAPYYLGNLLYDLQPQAAIKAWEQSAQLDATFATVHRNLALAYARVEKDNTRAVAAMEKAVACDAKDARLYAELDNLYEATNTDPQKRLALLQQNHDAVAQRDDALRREIALEILLGEYDRAIGLLDAGHFRLWEGESVTTHELYVDAHVLRAQKSLAARQYAEALKDCEAALEYPERFETARPNGVGGKMVQVYYVMGTVYEAMGQADKARPCYEQAARGRGEISENRYYQSLAQRKMGQEDQASRGFDELIGYGTERLQAGSDVDFFAKFGGRQSIASQKTRAHYLLGLGYLGKGKPAEAKKEFEAALQLNVSHLGARTMLSRL
ncbi:MAG: DUF5107 domain-containing protein [Tepidisphaerales bacterium]